MDQNFPYFKLEPNQGKIRPAVTAAGNNSTLPSLDSGVSPKFVYIRAIGGDPDNVNRNLSHT